MSTRISFKVHGQVQGVNFRSYTAESAESLGLTGFVSNHDAGHVEGEAQGDQGKIDEFLKEISKGPRAAKVENVEHDKMETKSGERGFTPK